MVPSLRERRRRRPVGQTAPRPQAKANGLSKAAFGKASFERCQSQRVFDRPVDLSADRRSDRTSQRRSLPRRSHSQADGIVGVVVSEAREASDRTRRRADRAMGDEGLAAYKKTPHGATRTSFSSMKQGFSCCRPSSNVGTERPNSQYDWDRRKCLYPCRIQ